MDSNATLPPQMKAQFALLADYLGKAQKAVIDVSKGNTTSLEELTNKLDPSESIPTIKSNTGHQ